MKNTTIALAATLVLSLLTIGAVAEPATLVPVDPQPMKGMDGYVQWPFAELGQTMLAYMYSLMENVDVPYAYYTTLPGGMKNWNN